MHELSKSISLLAFEVSENTRPDEIWSLADQVFQSMIGHLLFTVLRHDESSGTVRRLYSSRPELYKVGGSKEMRHTGWGDLVLKRGHPFLGKDKNDLRWAFPDYELLTSEGMESVLNIPVRFSGKTLGTLNLTHHKRYFQNEHIPVGILLAAQLSPLMHAID